MCKIEYSGQASDRDQAPQSQGSEKNSKSRHMAASMIIAAIAVYQSAVRKGVASPISFCELPSDCCYCQTIPFPFLCTVPRRIVVCSAC